MDCSPPGSSVLEIIQARILEWVDFPFSRGASQSRDRTQVSSIAGWFFTVRATRKVQSQRSRLGYRKIETNWLREGQSDELKCSTQELDSFLKTQLIKNVGKVGVVVGVRCYTSALLSPISILGEPRHPQDLSWYQAQDIPSGSPRLSSSHPTAY